MNIDTAALRRDLIFTLIRDAELCIEQSRWLIDIARAYRDAGNDYSLIARTIADARMALSIAEALWVGLRPPPATRKTSAARPRRRRSQSVSA